MPDGRGVVPRLGKFFFVSSCVLLVFLAVPPASAAPRSLLPEIGFGGGIQDSRTGAMSLVKLDLGAGMEWVRHRGSYGLVFRLDRFWLPPVQDIYRLHAGLLGYYSFGRPLRLRRVRVAAGAFLARWERYHEPYAGYGLQAEVSVGLKNFVDWWMYGYYDAGEQTYSACVMTGLRFSTHLFRLIRYDKRIDWR